MSIMWVITIEGRGDGSSNYTDYFRPSINIYDNVDSMRTALTAYMRANYEWVIYDIEKIIREKYFRINYYAWIRISRININGEITSGKMYDD